MNFNKKIFGDLLYFLDTSSSLKELDISYAEVGPKEFSVLFDQLKNNRRLTHVNLSWNTLFESKRGETDLQPSTKNSIDSLNTFIKRNKNLIHLDLSHTSLQS